MVMRTQQMFSQNFFHMLNGGHWWSPCCIGWMLTSMAHQLMMTKTNHYWLVGGVNISWLWGVLYELLRSMDLGRPKLGSGGTQKYVRKRGLAPSICFMTSNVMRIVSSIRILTTILTTIVTPQNILRTITVLRIILYNSTHNEVDSEKLENRKY